MRHRYCNVRWATGVAVAVSIATAGAGADTPSPEDLSWMGGTGATLPLDASRWTPPPPPAERPAWMDRPARADDSRDAQTLLQQATRIGQDAIATAGKQCDQPHSQAGDPVAMYVFISLSMPPGVLSHLFAQAAGQADVVFVMRGWDAPDLAGTVGRLREHFPANGPEPRVIIQPALFTELNVEAVPVFARQTPTGWRRLLGEIGVAGAQARLAGDEPLPDTAIGPIHAIEEPNIIELAQARAEAFDWKQAKVNALTRWKASEAATTLPTATHDQVYWIDPSITVKKPIPAADGTLLVAAGTRINPLAYTTLSKRYVFFDARDDDQRRQVQQWIDADGEVTLVATHSGGHAQKVALAKAFNQVVYPLNPLLINRFGLQAVPAIVSQDGDRLRVEVIHPRSEKGVL